MNILQQIRPQICVIDVIAVRVREHAPPGSCEYNFFFLLTLQAKEDAKIRKNLTGKAGAKKRAEKALKDEADNETRFSDSPDSV